MNIGQSAGLAKLLSLTAKNAKAKFFQEKIGGKLPEQLFSVNDQIELNSLLSHFNAENKRRLDFQS